MSSRVTCTAPSSIFTVATCPRGISMPSLAATGIEAKTLADRDCRLAANGLRARSAAALRKPFPLRGPAPPASTAASTFFCCDAIPGRAISIHLNAEKGQAGGLVGTYVCRSRTSSRGCAPPDLQALLTDRGLRRRFLALCLPLRLQPAR